MNEFIGNLKKVKTFTDLKKLFKDNEKQIKKLALPLLVILIILCLWLKGNQPSDIEISGESGEITTEITASEVQTEPLNEIYVDIAGEVLNPGVYSVAESSRLFQVIELAGGVTDRAEMLTVNQADFVYDGQKIYIPAQGEAELSVGAAYAAPYNSGKSADGKININQADSTTLQEIPGIGPAKAQRIIDYRDSNGRFSSIEDLLNISGIGDKTLESMKPYITV